MLGRLTRRQQMSLPGATRQPPLDRGRVEPARQRNRQAPGGERRQQPHQRIATDQRAAAKFVHPDRALDHGAVVVAAPVGGRGAGRARQDVLPQRREHERLGGDESDERLRRFTDFAADDEERVVGTGRDRPLVACLRWSLSTLLCGYAASAAPDSIGSSCSGGFTRLVPPTICATVPRVRETTHFEPQRWPLLADHLGARVGQRRNSLGRERRPVSRSHDRAIRSAWSESAYADADVISVS